MRFWVENCRYALDVREIWLSDVSEEYSTRVRNSSINTDGGSMRWVCTGRLGSTVATI